MKLNTLVLLPALLSTALITNAAEIKTEQQQLSYIYGVQFGQNLKNDGFILDMDAFKAGFDDMINDNPPKIDQATAQRVIQSYQQQKQILLAEKAASKQKESEAYLANNAKEEGVKTSVSGLQYKVLKEGTGKSPTAQDKVVAHYTGKLLDGTVFDSSHERGEPATFPVSGVIKGWQEVLPMMKEGGHWQIVVPANLAYGDRGIGNVIGPNETLLFDIELISVEK